MIHRFETVDLGLIRQEANVRQLGAWNPSDDEEFAKSVARRLLHPLCVISREHGDELDLAAGHRRLHALQVTIPAMVRRKKIDPETTWFASTTVPKVAPVHIFPPGSSREQILLEENAHREDVHWTDWAEHFFGLVADGKTHSQIAQIVQKNRSWISKLVFIRRYISPPLWQVARLRDGRLSMTRAERIVRCHPHNHFEQNLEFGIQPEADASLAQPKSKPRGPKRGARPGIADLREKLNDLVLTGQANDPFARGQMAALRYAIGDDKELEHEDTHTTNRSFTE